MKTAILTDTNSGIMTQEAKSLGIHVMPMPILIEDEVYYEGQNITEEEFYNALVSEKKVTTSQPSPGDVLDTWDRLFSEGYDQIVYIPMSSGLSSACETAKSMSDDYDGKVFVADNHRISVTLRPSVITAKRMADRGDDGERIAAFLEEDALNASIYLAVDTLDYLKRGGRVSSAAAALGTLLNIKPILTIQGERLEPFANVRGSMRRGEERMLEALKNDIETRFAGVDRSRLLIGLAGAGLTDEEKAAWMELGQEYFPDAALYYDPLSASVAAHTGPGAVGLGVSVDAP
ncbi:MAG: DegV family protein [Lachnospiraceae bacterium]|nr:DegV family protein [Lachnospiraceae bacterium]